jgi:hypothetical protein
LADRPAPAIPDRRGRSLPQRVVSTAENRRQLEREELVDPSGALIAERPRADPPSEKTIRRALAQRLRFVVGRVAEASLGAFIGNALT